MPFAAALTSTCLVAGVMTIIMGAFTNRAYAIAPGMGLNAVVAFSLVLGQGLTFPQAMGLIFLEGLAILILVLTGFREAIFKAIPLELKKAIVVGIGFFILFIGLVDGGLVVGGGGTRGLAGQLRRRACARHHLRPRRSRSSCSCAAGVSRSSSGIIFSTHLRDDPQLRLRQDVVRRGHRRVSRARSWPCPTSACVGQFDFGAFGKLGVTAAILWIFSLMLSDFFDTMGTLVGVGGQAGYLDDKGHLKKLNRLLFIDSLAAMAGGAASSSSATTYIESGAGVAAGGRTGMVSIVTGVLFLLAMFFSPIAGIVPANATAPALIIVGFLMMATLSMAEEKAEEEEEGKSAARRAISAINFADPAFGIPAVLTMALMPLTYSITNGIGFGFISYTLIRVAQGKAREVSWMLWIATAGFLLYFLIPLLQSWGWF